MYTQIDIFDSVAGEQAAQKGIDTAVAHAETVHPGWAIETYNIFVNEFLPNHKRFMAEEFRSWLAVNKPEYSYPPHSRAFGGIIRKAKDAYYIICIGTGKVKNVKAHAANASLWETNTERLIENGIIN